MDGTDRVRMLGVATAHTVKRDSMRILFASIGAHGHLYPIVPFALAAHDLGHDVVFATAQQFHPALRAAGLRTVAAGGTVDEAFRTAMSEGAANGEAAFGAAFGRILPTRMITDLKPLLSSGGADLVVHGLGSPGAAIAGRLAGRPTAAVGIGRMVDGALAEAMFPPFQVIASAFGVTVADPRTMDGPYVDTCPPSLQIPGFARTVDSVPARFTPWNPGGELPPAVMRRSRPLVYVTLGTVFADVEVFRKVIGGLATLPVDIVVATGPRVDAGLVGDVPPQVTLLDWVPQAKLLPHVDVVVHHGGSGTTLGAAAHGIPQAIVPLGADQHANATEIVRAGCGRQLDAAALDGDRIADVVGKLLSDQEIAVATGKLAAETAALPSPEEVISSLTRRFG